jgi:hypothetical protein
MRLERHHCRYQTTAARRADNLPDQRLMAAMHAIEIADRQRARVALSGAWLTTENLHRRASKWRLLAIRNYTIGILHNFDFTTLFQAGAAWRANCVARMRAHESP